MANYASAASVSPTSWSMCACIRAVGGRGGAGVDLQVVGFLPLLGPAGIFRVTEMARVVIGSSLGEGGGFRHPWSRAPNF